MRTGIHEGRVAIADGVWANCDPRMRRTRGPSGPDGDAQIGIALVGHSHAIWSELGLMLVTWCLFGMAIRSFLKSPRALRITALVMAAVLAASVVMLFA